jgi:predicted secreted Zn-dependent protease
MTIYRSAPGDLDWRVSHACDSGACIMVARHGDSVVFGNTTNPGGPIFAYTRAEWNEFIVGVKSGDFDDIA